MGQRHCDDDVLVALLRGAKSRGQIWQRVNVAQPESVSRALRRLMNKGYVKRVRYGHYEVSI